MILLAQADIAAPAVSEYFGSAIIEYLPFFLRGMGMTIAISFWAAIVSFVIGLVVALLRVTPSGGLKIVAAAFTEFFRNTPLFVQVLVFYFGLPKLGINLRFNIFGFEITDRFAAGTLSLGIYTGAYVAEAIRSGLLAIPKGQSEAARSLGLSLLQTLRLVVVPQAIRLVLPPLGNLYSAMLKNSAILSSIGVADLMFQADYVNNRTFKTFEVITAVVVFYLILTLPMGWFVHWLEKKYNPLRAKTLRLRGARI
jgi:putative glutamine transport system permease protein